MSVKKLVATFAGDFQDVEVDFMFEDGAQEHKVVSLSDYLMSIQESVEVGREFLHLGKLPNGYYNGCVSKDDTSSFKVVIAMPERRRLINYYGDCYGIPFPSMAFFLDVRLGKLFTSLAVSLDLQNSDWIGDDSVVCRYPFGNVHSNYKICWGTNRELKVSSIYDAGQYITQFFGSETNNDLYSAGQNVLALPEFTNQRGLFEALMERDRFPDEWLIKQELTLGQMVENFLV